MMDRPEQVFYGNAANSKKIKDLYDKDEELEMKHMKRINYTKKDKKMLRKKIR